MALKIDYRRPPPGAFARNMTIAQQNVAFAATQAFRDAAKQVQTGGRTRIAAAGFSRRWQTGFRVYGFPRNGYTLTPALKGFHTIGYANIFERGGTIKGKPLLWLPLPSAPAKVNGKPVTPRALAEVIGPLHSINRSGKPPMLAGYAPKQIATGRSASVAQLRAGNRNFRRRQAARAFGGKVRAAAVLVPLFVGIKAAHIARRFDVSAEYDRARRSLPALYQRRFRQVNR